MALIETEGIVLQSRRFSETSKILVLFTRTRGKVSLLFKGGRKGTKKFPGGTESLNRIEVKYYHRSSRDLQNLKSFDLIDAYPKIHEDLVRTYTAWSVAEAVLRATAEEDPNERLYADLTTCLATLNLQPRFPYGIRWKGLMDICRSLGFAMAFDEDETLNGKAIRGFDLQTGAFTESRGGKPGETVIAASGEVWGVMRFLQRCTYIAAGRVRTRPAVGKWIETIFNNYFRYHVPGLKKFESWEKLPEIYWGS